ncbi:MAG: hypothetical protein ACPL3C_02995 [Pyrobaculum sp.]|uniref:hypothetical protein n=1 Tax=Pyrobaculum sp. TaxID=2004705 RepID=UPI003CB047A2
MGFLTEAAPSRYLWENLREEVNARVVPAMRRISAWIISGWLVRGVCSDVMEMKTKLGDIVAKEEGWSTARAAAPQW